MAKLEICGSVYEYPAGTSYEEVAKDFQDKYNGNIALVLENNKIRELFRKVGDDAKVSFVTLSDSIGHKAYSRSAIMIMLKAFEDVLGRDCIETIKVEFVIANGFYCTPVLNTKLTSDIIAKVKARMEEIVAENLSFAKETITKEAAIELFTERKMFDKVKLFKYRRSSTINVYKLGDYVDYFYGFMLPSTGYVKWFDIFLYDDGFMLTVPRAKNPNVCEEFDDRSILFKTLKTTTEWSSKLEVSTVGELNDAICQGKINDLILVQEALQERRIGEIAQDIVNRGGVKFVMIAGPSSSGKTTFSHRLSVQLRTYGLKPHPIACDDYFVDREKTPRDENGDYNFECLEAIDVEQFNKDMCELLEGKRVELPSFNFKTGQREYTGNFMQLGEDDILVIEGIHGLNDKMSYKLPTESKFKIYISALTCLNIDGHNRIPTTDGRLLRRMVRDARTRGTVAGKTIRMWPSVRRGEEENIFPFQESADVMFNSALIFELAALKLYAEPLLHGIGKDEPEYYEAQRLLKFLGYFVAIPSDKIPINSLAREFVGGSIFKV